MFGFRSKYANATYGVIAVLVLMCFGLSIALVQKPKTIIVERQVPTTVIKEIFVTKEVPVTVVKEVEVVREVKVFIKPKSTRPKTNYVPPAPYVVELNGCLYNGSKDKALTPIDRRKTCY